MASILGMFFLIILAILAFIGVIVGFVLNRIFNLGRRKNSSSAPRSQDKFQDPQRGNSSPGSRKKIFDDNDGEYVDYEEIDD